MSVYDGNTCVKNVTRVSSNYNEIMNLQKLP